MVLMGQSRWHGKEMEGGLNAGDMSVRYGVSQQKMRNTTINKLETYPAKLKVGDIQSLTFTYGDARPFYLSDKEREGLKFDVFSGKKKIMRKNEKCQLTKLRRVEIRTEDTSPKIDPLGARIN